MMKKRKLHHNKSTVLHLKKLRRAILLFTITIIGSGCTRSDNSALPNETITLGIFATRFEFATDEFAEVYADKNIGTLTLSDSEYKIEVSDHIMGKTDPFLRSIEFPIQGKSIFDSSTDSISQLNNIDCDILINESLTNIGSVELLATTNENSMFTTTYTISAKKSAQGKKILILQPAPVDQPVQMFLFEMRISIC